MNPLRKTLKIGIFFAILGIILMTSCKKNVTGGSSAALEIIPADATFVISVDYENIVRKGKLNDFDNYAFLQKIKAEIVDDAPENVQELILNFVQNPSALGLNTDKFYIFGLPSGDDRGKSSGVSFTFNIDKQSVFEENIKKIDENIEIEDKGAFKTVKGHVLPFSWNSEIAVLHITEQCRDGSDCRFEDALFEKKTSITHNENLHEFIGTESDLKAWFKVGDLLDLSEKLNVKSTENQPLTDIFGKINYLVAINFDNGEIRFDCKAFPESEVDRVNEKYPILKNDFDDKLLGDFPEETFMLFKLAFSVKDYIRLLRDSKIFDSEYYNPLDDPDVQKVSDALAGDFVLDVQGFADGFMPVPLVGLGFTVTGRQGFEDILSLIPQGIIKKYGDIYTVTLPELPFISIFIAEKDNRVIVSNNQKHIEAFAGKGLGKSLKDSGLPAKYKNSVNFSYINLNLNTYPLSIRGLLNNLGENSGNIVAILNRLHSFTSWQENKYSSSGSLKFTDDSTNSLQTLLEIIDDISIKYLVAE
jgi:hypothetical protein